MAQLDPISLIRNAPDERTAMANADLYLSTIDPRTAREINALPPDQRQQAIAQIVAGLRSQPANNDSGGRDAAAPGSGAMTASQAMNAVAIGRGLSDYGSLAIAPGAIPAGLVGNALMSAGQNALSSLDGAMLGISPGGNGDGPSGGGMTGGPDGMDIGPGYSFAEGGEVKPQNLLGPNPKGKDDGFAALDAGEFVVSADAAKRVGVDKLHALNAGRAGIVSRAMRKAKA